MSWGKQKEEEKTQRFKNERIIVSILFKIEQILMYLGQDTCTKKSI